MLSKPCVVRHQLLFSIILSGINRLHLPCHVHEQFNLVFGRLDVANVQNPEPLYPLVPSLRHLLEHERRRESAEPQIVVRPSPVAHVVVYSVAALACPFFSGREVAHIAVVVVTPDKANVVRHFQSGFIYIEHLLVWNKKLRHPGSILVNIFGEQSALILYNPLQNSLLLIHGLSSLHSPVVNTAHTDSIKDRLLVNLLYAVLPEFVYIAGIIDIVIISLTPYLPFRSRT